MTSVLISPVVPGPSGFGLRMRAGMLLDALCRLGPARVIVVPVHGPRPTVDAELGATPCTVLDIDLATDARRDLRARLVDPPWREQAAVLHPRPSLCRTATLEAAEQVAELVRGADLVVVTRLYLAPFLDAVLADPRRATCVIDVDDVESSTRHRFGDHEEAESYERLERHYLPRFDRVVAGHAGDAAHLAERDGVHADVVPNAVPIVDEEPAADPRWDLLFVGNFGYRPNVDAATWLCQHVLPQLPSTSAALVGREPPSEVRALARDGSVEVVGTVPAIDPYYAESSVAVVPVQAGGGTSIKLLEAFAHARPVVSTSAGARGLPVRDGEHLLVADDPAAFATACRRLLTDAPLARKLAAAGHDLVRGGYAWDDVAARLADLLR